MHPHSCTARARVPASTRELTRERYKPDKHNGGIPRTNPGWVPWGVPKTHFPRAPGDITLLLGQSVPWPVWAQLRWLGERAGAAGGQSGSVELLRGGGCFVGRENALGPLCLHPTLNDQTMFVCLGGLALRVRPRVLRTKAFHGQDSSSGREERALSLLWNELMASVRTL